MNIKNYLLVLIFLLSSLFCSSAPPGKREQEGYQNRPQRKSKLAAFLISFFFGGFGADWFYLSKGYFTYIFAGIVKLLFKFCCCCCCFGLKSASDSSGGVTVLLQCLKLPFGIWWLVDWIRILCDAFPDGAGMELMNDL